MPNWLLPVIVSVVGSGGLVGLIAPVVNHRFQQRREHEREGREARAAWVARQRDVCTSLLDVVIRYRGVLLNTRSVHDSLASRFTAKKTFELMLRQLPSFDESVRSFRRELDLEPNAHLQGAIERFVDAATAYHQALIRPMLSWWNPVQLYIGKAPQDEVNRLADDFDARTHELQAAVREYMASLEPPVKAMPARRLPRLPKLPWRRQRQAQRPRWLALLP